MLVPVDKAGNNIAIICKHYYISLLKKELSSTNFTEVNTSVNDILGSHKQFLDKCSIEVDDKHNKLPFLYFTAKVHKAPMSSRFITYSKYCRLSILSQKVFKNIACVPKIIPSLTVSTKVILKTTLLITK